MKRHLRANDTNETIVVNLDDDFNRSPSPCKTPTRKKVPMIRYLSDSGEDDSDAEIVMCDVDIESIGQTIAETSSSSNDEEIQEPNAATWDAKWDPITTDTTAIDECHRDAEVLSTITDSNDPLLLYKLFLTDDIIEYMIVRTNEYAENCRASRSGISPSTSRSHQQNWIPITRDEMHRFIGILLVMSIVYVPDLRLHWSNKTMYTNLLIKKSMSRDRFLDILKYWHFCDSSQPMPDEHLYKINTVIEKINGSFRGTVRPGKEIVIDEDTIAWRHNRDVRLFRLCLPEGYTYKIDVHTGKRGNPLVKGCGIVMKLMTGLLNEGRILYTDNSNTSVSLAEELLRKNTFLCGPIHTYRKFLPREANEKQKKGEIMTFQNGNGVKFMKWTNKKSLMMLTTYKNHRCSLIETNQNPSSLKRQDNVVRTPDAVLSYNNAKKGLQVLKQMSLYFSIMRKTIKWHKKVMMELICSAMLINAWCVHKRLNESSKISILQFRESIIYNLLTPLNAPLPTPRKRKQHFLKKYHGASKGTRKRCKECYHFISRNEGREAALRKTKKVITYCPDCDNQPALCLQCFEKIHT